MIGYDGATKDIEVSLSDSFTASNANPHQSDSITSWVGVQ
jgi:hypothetical protein